jgi:tRNA pseudouridine55 synthase
MAGMLGFLNVHKPAGPTSHDVVATVRRMLPRKTRVGHAGTLDPFASGVLVLCIGRATRLADFVQAQPKRYRAEVTLGAVSRTDDTEGPITTVTDAAPPSPPAVAEAVRAFVGRIEQVPPAHSAVHVDGKRAYDLARKGDAPDLPARPVEVRRIEVLDYAWPRLTIEVACGSGTYIRSLARDLGAALGVGGYCSRLVRTAVGAFEIGSAIAPDQLNFARDLIAPLAGLGDLPQVTIDAEGAALVLNGRPVPAAGAVPSGTVALIGPDGRLLAIAEADDNRLRPAKVFPPERS